MRRERSLLAAQRAETIGPTQASRNLPRTDSVGPFRGTLAVTVTMLWELVGMSEVIERAPVAEIDWVAQFPDRQLLDLLPIGVNLCRMDGQIIYVNPAYATMLGYSVAETFHLTYWQITPSHYAVQESEQLRLLETTGRYGPYEKHYIHRDGSLIPVQLSGRLIELGGEQYIWSNVEDISDRRAIEAQLQVSESQFRQLVENTSDVIFSHDLRGHFQYLSPAFTKVLGYAATDWIGKTLASIVHPSDLDQVDQLLPQLLAEGEHVNNLNLRVKHQTGHWLWMLVSHSLVRDAAGDVIGVQGMAKDITALKALEAELQASQEQYRTIFENIQDGLSILDLETGRTLAINPAMHQMHGYDHDEFMTLHPTQYIHPDSHGIFANFLTTLSAGGIFETEGIDVRNDGTLFNVSVSAITCLYEGKRCIVSSLRNITLQKAAEEQIQQQKLKLEQTLQELQRTQSQMIQSEKMSSLGQMVAGVAHEINNPVNFIYGNLKYTADYTQDLLRLVQAYQARYPQQDDALEAIMEEIDLDYLITDLPNMLGSMKVGADRIREIVLSLRNFSRLDEADFKEADLHQGIDSTLMIMQNKLKGRDHRPDIPVIKAYGTMPPVECYAGQLNQVFMNLLVNAADALDEAVAAGKITAPEIQIQTAVVADQAEIRIIDNGPGIPAEVQARLFDPFYTTKPVGQGTGMGLSISYQIVTERHGGSLACESASGQGTQFIIRIPLRHPDAPIG
jgi:PAS domain S-box-containing protein